VSENVPHLESSKAKACCHVCKTKTSKSISRGCKKPLGMLVKIFSKHSSVSCCIGMKSKQNVGSKGSGGSEGIVTGRNTCPAGSGI